MPRLVVSNLGAHCLPRSACTNTHGKYAAVNVPRAFKVNIIALYLQVSSEVDVYSSLLGNLQSPDIFFTFTPAYFTKKKCSIIRTACLSLIIVASEGPSKPDYT